MSPTAHQSTAYHDSTVTPLPPVNPDDIVRYLVVQTPTVFGDMMLRSKEETKLFNDHRAPTIQIKELIFWLSKSTGMLSGLQAVFSDGG